MNSFLTSPTSKIEAAGAPALQSSRSFRVKELDYGNAPQFDARDIGRSLSTGSFGGTLQKIGGTLSKMAEAEQEAIDTRKVAEAGIILSKAKYDLAAEVVKEENNPDTWEGMAKKRVDEVGKIVLTKDLSPRARREIEIRTLQWGTSVTGEMKVAKARQQFSLTGQSLQVAHKRALEVGNFESAAEARAAIAPYASPSLIGQLEDDEKATKIGLEDSAAEAALTRGDIDTATQIYQNSGLRDDNQKTVVIGKLKKIHASNEETRRNKSSAEFYGKLNYDAAKGILPDAATIDWHVAEGAMTVEDAAPIMAGIKRREAGLPANPTKFNDFINNRVLKYNPTTDLTGGEYEKIQREAAAMGIDQIQAARLEANLRAVVESNKTPAGRSTNHVKSFALDRVNDLMKAGAFGPIMKDDTEHVMGALSDPVKMRQFGLTEKQAERLSSLNGVERLNAFREFASNRYYTESGARKSNIVPAEYNKLSTWTQNLLNRAAEGKVSMPDPAKASEAAGKAAQIQDQFEAEFQRFSEKNKRPPNDIEAKMMIKVLTEPYSNKATEEWDTFEPPVEKPQASNGKVSIRGFVDAQDLAEKLPETLSVHATDFLEAAQKYNLNPKTLAAIAMHETGNGTSKAFKSKKNAMGVSNSSGPITFDSVRDSIFAQAKSLSGDLYKGADDLDSVGRIYAPVGAENDPTSVNSFWPGGVAAHFAKLQ